MDIESNLKIIFNKSFAVEPDGRIIYKNLAEGVEGPDTAVTYFSTCSDNKLMSVARGIVSVLDLICPIVYRREKGNESLLPLS